MRRAEAWRARHVVHVAGPWTQVGCAPLTHAWSATTGSWELDASNSWCSTTARYCVAPPRSTLPAADLASLELTLRFGWATRQQTRRAGLPAQRAGPLARYDPPRLSVLSGWMAAVAEAPPRRYLRRGKREAHGERVESGGGRRRPGG